ncbi:MAG: 16S rRNA (adenine(1518)-N(6)/adenine(1519)-N(6))-dimethyltransferase RsmA [Treponema sp.]|jgi:16S rRNA (adenine1518-N6/adenine1519-N6)-dimethyltransferase|nr:16S rRNA (adenine(1518)-N(6)/adenine(1519)-N(6))-dimethyltransferase RsmA [Treponema sp.]
MLNYNSAAALSAFLEREGLGMLKKFGQNFLINPQIRQTLVETLGACSTDEVWEIGPGLGAMTALLLEKGLNVKTFEIDLGFIRVLKKMFSDNDNFNLIEGDVLKTWFSQYTSTVQPFSAPFLLGNLPYNIAAALIANFIEKRCVFSRMVVTVQKEVALRMAASAGSKDYSSFSVLCASTYNVKPLMTITPSSFFPQPNVDSMGVLFEKKASVINGEQAEYLPVFYPLVRSLFASRRKTVKNNLFSFLSSRKPLAKEATREICTVILNENGINENQRAENLELEAFFSLAKTIYNMRL